MEQDIINLYLQQVSKHLETLTEKQRKRALDEIALHIKTSRAIGRSAEAALERLVEDVLQLADTDGDGVDDELADTTKVINCIFLNNVVGNGDDIMGSTLNAR